jgi:hypothetical protein
LQVDVTPVPKETGVGAPLKPVVRQMPVPMPVSTWTPVAGERMELGPMWKPATVENVVFFTCIALDPAVPPLWIMTLPLISTLREFAPALLVS